VIQQSLANHGFASRGYQVSPIRLLYLTHANCDVWFYVSGVFFVHIDKINGFLAKGAGPQ
jgi:hypothetical protein